MKLALAAVVAVLAATAGCGENASAHVNCKVTEAAAVECTVEQTKGKTAVEVCWDFKVTCESGATLEAPNTCTTVKDGQTSNVTIAADKIQITGQCDKVKDAVVSGTSLKKAE